MSWSNARTIDQSELEDLQSAAWRARELDHAARLASFHEACGQPFGHGHISDSELRIRLHREETKELVDALEAGDLIGAARELADVVYVAYGTAHSLGLPLDALIAEVHRANMSKFGPDDRPVLDEGGKVLKGPHFRPPDIRWVLDRAMGCTCLPDEEDSHGCGLHGSYEPY